MHFQNRNGKLEHEKQDSALEDKADGGQMRKNQELTHEQKGKASAKSQKQGHNPVLLQSDYHYPYHAPK